MHPDWEEIEENEEIKKEFLDYSKGLCRHKETGLVMPPSFISKTSIYKVKPRICWLL